MKVAIVHDYIKEYGGAERVLEALLEIYPEADVYTTVFLPAFLGPHKDRFKTYKIHTSWAQFLPFKAKLISPMRVIAPFLFKAFDFSKYDLIIVSATGSYLPNSINKNKAVHISYTHTPPRYLYGYETARNWKSNLLSKAIGMIMIHFLRQWDYKYAQNPDFYIANSNETKARIEKFYRRKAIVIYPPVDLPNISEKDIKKEDFYVTGGRIARAKHTDLIIDAFLKNGLNLKVFGKGFAGFEAEIKEKLQNKKNVQFLGEVSDLEKFELMKKSKAFIFASKDEDFGITPVEAMACGTPVIAFGSGGVLETVIENKTGLFYDELSVDCLNLTLENFEKLKLNSKDSINQAQKFGKERFKKEILEFVKNALNK
jgi:glycosyltransferase involved in cell wall biosynthesis